MLPSAPCAMVLASGCPNMRQEQCAASRLGLLPCSGLSWCSPSVLPQSIADEVIMLKIAWGTGREQPLGTFTRDFGITALCPIPSVSPHLGHACAALLREECVWSSPGPVISFYVAVPPLSLLCCHYVVSAT
jgi:hypothetical protein